MINSIPTVESKNKNVFGSVTKKTLPSDYWLRPTVVNKKDELSKKIIISPTEARATNNAKIIGISIASATVLTALGIFFVLKGGFKNLSKNFSKFKDYLEKKVQTSKLNNEGRKSLNMVYNLIIKGIDSSQQRFEAVNNFTTFKDLLFKKIMYSDFGLKKLHLTGSTNYGKKIHSKITEFFEKIGKKAVDNTYSVTRQMNSEKNLLIKRINKEILDNPSSELIEINGISKTKSEWVTEIKRLNNAYNTEFENGFSDEFLEFRALRIKKVIDSLKDSFDKLKVFVSWDFLKSFMAEGKIAKEKAAIKNDVKQIRQVLTYSIADFVKDSDDKIIQMTRDINYKDVDKINMLRDLRQNFKTLKKSKSLTPELKAEIMKNIDLLKGSISKSVSDKTMDENVSNNLLKGLVELNSSVNNFKQGQAESILEIYQKILKPEDFALMKKSYNDCIKSLDKSINLETEEYVSKLRDLSLGSAPTDILTILGSLITLGYQIGKSENNEERASIALKYGIPALAGIGVSLYCNAKLFAGSKSLLIGALSTVVVNYIGGISDKLLKQYQHSKKNIANNSSNTSEQNLGFKNFQDGLIVGNKLNINSVS